jgi:hypothetical protein
MSKAGMIMAMAAALADPGGYRYDHEIGHSFPLGQRPGRVRLRKRNTTKSVETKDEARARKKAERQRKKDARKNR